METATELVHTPQQSCSAAALAPVIETASTAVAAQEEAKIKARYALAIARPRDIDNVRVKLLAACKRPRFADAAIYSLPRAGKAIEGPSIRFAEEAARCLGNLTIDSAIIHDDAERRIVRVTVVDVESNLPFSQDVVVEKFVERKKLPQGVVALSNRVKPNGEVIFRIPADEGELLVKQAALTSKAVRTLIMRVLPGDILDEAMWQCRQVRAAEVKEDPTKVRRWIVDSFAAIHVKPSDLKLYVGHDLEHLDERELDELRGVYQAVKDGETSWADALAAKRPDKQEGAPAAGEKPRTVEQLAAQRKAKKDAEQQKPADAAPTDREPGSDG